MLEVNKLYESLLGELIKHRVTLTRTNVADGENAEVEATERAIIVAVNFILLILF